MSIKARIASLIASCFVVALMIAPSANQAAQIVGGA
jgi:hypothetical protein